MPDDVEYAVVENVTRLGQDLENSHRCGGYGYAVDECYLLGGIQRSH